MNPIQDFQDALKEFKKISSEFVDRGRTLKPGEHRLGRVKKFNNLSEFKEYHSGTYYFTKEKCTGTYKKKTDVVYKKRNITQKITVDRKEDPKAWDAQYHWFRNHPDKDVYEPEKYYPRPALHPRLLKPSEITKKITVKRSEDPKEYHKQYYWFKKHPDATKYEACEVVKQTKDISKKITVKYLEDKKEYHRQYNWFKKHPEENICPPKC